MSVKELLVYRDSLLMQRNYSEILATRSLSRRQLIRLIQASATVTLAGYLANQAALGKPKNPAATVQKISCVVKPQQTEGPYFVDERLNRSDIRTDPTDNLVSKGTALRLIFHVSQVGGNSCKPFSGATVDLWHCDASGVYSDVSDRSFNTQEKKFLRGYQVTDKNGTAQFITIYPGWYPGRAVHIHFKIRTDAATQKSYEFTSQLYFDDLLTDKIHAQSPYSSKGQRLKNEQDGIFQDGGKDLILRLSKDEKGYVGTFDIGLQA
jgi:protocatechuate 3,4-dioxygenase beta subunit